MRIEKSNLMRSKVILLFLILSGSLFSQKDALKKANDFIAQKNYRSALLQLNQIPNVETSAPLLFKKARCNYEINKLDQALAQLTRVESMGYKDNSILYYKGRTLHHKGNFKQAISAYKSFLKGIDLDDPRRIETREHIKNAGAALDILYIDPIATIENAGPKINSKYSEARMVQSAGSANKYYFSTDKPAKNQKVSSYLSQSYAIDQPSDINIYSVSKIDDEWEQAVKHSDRSINTYKNDFLLDLSLDGSSLYVLRGKDEIHELVSHSTDTEMKRRVKQLVDLVGGTEHFHFFNDSTVVFSSDILEGEGGYDLYITAYVNDKWLMPKNLGKEINSPKDEITPYLSNDGSQLFYSSNRSFSVGGFDVFRSRYLYEQGVWTGPKNLGLPINSPGDETHFRLSDDGLISTYTSDRKDGYGSTDLYFAYFNEKNEHQEFTVKDLSFVDYPDFYLKKIEEPILADATLSDQKDNQEPNRVNASIPSTNAMPLVKKELSLPTLFPNAEGDLFTKANYEKLDILADQLISLDVGPVEIMSFSHKEGIAEYNLFLSIKNAEKVKEALVERGVSKSKIHLKGFGDFLPIIKSTVSESQVVNYNNRVEFKINIPDDKLTIEYAPLDINKSYLNKGYDIFRTLIDDAVSYKIQIATVRQMYRGTALNLYNDVQVELDPRTGNYLYSVGLYDDFIEANNIMMELSEKGITTLKIIPFVDGLRIEEGDLVTYASDYPNLKEYIRSIAFIEEEED